MNSIGYISFKAIHDHFLYPLNQVFSCSKYFRLKSYPIDHNSIYKKSSLNSLTSLDLLKAAICDKVMQKIPYNWIICITLSGGRHGVSKQWLG